MYCSAEELDAVRQDQMDRGETPKYNGHCSHLDEETKAKYIAEVVNQQFVYAFL